MNEPIASRTLFVLWLTVALVLVAGAASLLVASERYQWELRLADLPIVEFALVLCAAGLAVAVLVPLVCATVRAGLGSDWRILALILAAGVAMRALMIPSQAVLEDDFYRYLWDGAVTAAGMNPFSLAPGAARLEAAPPPVRALAEAGGGVLDRVNHPHLKTIYPPVAQAAFAMGHWIEPWSLRAWRLVCLGGELATVAALLALLVTLGRPLAWMALYWLNPLVVKELLNSAHMEAIVLPLVMASVLLLARRRALWAVVPLGLAIGAKIWPAVLVPLVLRPLLARPGRLVVAVAMLGAIVLASALPPLLGGIDGQSGFVAYASYWQTNSALFQSVLRATRWLFEALALPGDLAGTASRLAVAGLVGVIALTAAWRPAAGPRDVVMRARLTVIALFLLSPAQFPWYGTWALVFLPFWPLAGLIGLTVFLPLYYASFHFVASGEYGGIARWLVWLEWVPIWLLLAFDVHRAWNRPLRADAGMPEIIGGSTSECEPAAG